MITTQGQRQLTILRVSSNCLRDRLADFGHKSGVLQLANWRVLRDRRSDFFELVVAIELDLPTQLFKLLWEARFY